jgi:hypothetical protein
MRRDEIGSADEINCIAEPRQTEHHISGQSGKAGGQLALNIAVKAMRNGFSFVVVHRQKDLHEIHDKFLIATGSDLGASKIRFAGMQVPPRLFRQFGVVQFELVQFFDG